MGQKRYEMRNKGDSEAIEYIQVDRGNKRWVAAAWSGPGWGERVTSNGDLTVTSQREGVAPSLFEKR